MEIVTKILKELGFTADYTKENFDVKSAVDNFFNEKFEIFKERSEIKELEKNARNEGKIIATKEYKKAIKKRYGIDIAIDEPTEINEVLDLLDKKNEEKIQEVSKDKKESEEILRLKSENEKLKSTLTEVNESFDTYKVEVETKLVEKDNEWQGKFKERELKEKLKDDLSKRKFILDTNDVMEFLEAKIKKENIKLNLNKDKIEVVNDKGEKIMNEDGRTLLNYDTLIDRYLDGIKVKSNGTGESNVILGKKIEDMPDEQRKMYELASLM